MEFDKSDECVACEMFITVFDACLNKDSSNIDKIDLNTLCDNVEILYRDQVNTKQYSWYYYIVGMSKMCNYYSYSTLIDDE